MRFCRSYVFPALLSLVATKGYTQDLVFSYQPGNAMPYAILEKDQLVGGIIMDLGQAVGQHLKMPVKFESTSRNRSDETLRAYPEKNGVKSGFKE